MQAISRLMTPVLALFIVSNLVNVGNLAYNMVFGRWMGPTAFGELSVFLTVFLAVMGVSVAAQMATSQHIAGLPGSEKDSHINALKRFARLGLATGLAAVGAVSLALWFLAPTVLQLSPMIAALSILPVALPLAILRGIMLAELEVAYFSASLISEWAIRTIGGVIIWVMGGGVFGVCLFVAISPYIAFAFAKPLSRINHPHPKRSELAPVFHLTFAMLALQLSQFVLLESDLLIAARFLPDDAIGEHAALILLQRIVFFGCFGLSVALVPTVAAARAREEPVAPHLIPVVFVFGSIAAVVLISSWLMPNLVVGLFMGEAYLGVSSLLLPAIFGATLLTASYLGATVLKALNDNSGIVMLCLVAVVQPLAILNTLSDSPSLDQVVQIKMLVQVALLLAMIWRILQHASIERRGEKRIAPIGPMGDTVVTKKNGAKAPFLSLKRKPITSQ